MKIVVAMDSFKGSLTAVRACEIVADAIRATTPRAEVVLKPMADGGEGTAAALMRAAGGQWVEQEVMGPLPQMRVHAGFVWLAQDRTAVVEMATASGLQLLRREQLNPLKTTTYGTGQLIRAAVEFGAERILLAIGGSATVDGGVGAAAALGWRLLDGAGVEVGPGGGELSRIGRIISPEHELRAVVEVLCDVDNPLCGEHGAAAVYGPQKGATPEMVETLETGLRHLADLVQAHLGRDLRGVPGAGAAGGLAAGAVAFMNARLVSGIDEIMSRSGLRDAVADADWVVTGEGRFDAQSLRGKVVSGVTRISREAGARTAVIAGQILLTPDAYQPAGIETALSCMTDGMDLEVALANSELLLARAARKLASQIMER